MSSEIKVSVIVPVYNTEEYLERCLNSLSEQTLDGIEIVIVNDGSPDNSQAIIDRFTVQHTDKAVALCQENKGLGPARNLGVAAARGEYIGFVDSDDWVAEEMFETMYNSAKKEDADIVMCDYFTVRKNGECKASGLLDGVMGKITSISRFVLNSTSPSMACIRIFKKHLLQQTRFAGGWYEDLGTIPVIISNCRKIVTVNKPFYYYFKHDGAITAQYNDPRNLDLLKGWKRCLVEGNEKYRKEMAFAVYLSLSQNVELKKEYMAEFLQFFRENESCFENNIYIDEAIKNNISQNLFEMTAQPDTSVPPGTPAQEPGINGQAAMPEQFMKEAAELVKIIRALIDSGQLAGAGQLLDQYALLNPADPQIAELRDTIAKTGGL